MQNKHWVTEAQLIHAMKNTSVEKSKYCKGRNSTAPQSFLKGEKIR